ncbi:NADPH:quinone oxidoreductase family protein [Vibrio rhizosphaerae]|uniref:NADPH:quinone oxidoreductase family protein n=1 Tax=Vibrio rhizosphaerae TaxID=398736 RepID=UPI00056DAEE2|nr:NADPH:quinone oxidoreductase family protein [Vibrio rhizosphaerae]
MRALLSKTTGGPDSLELCEVPDPELAPNEVLIKVRSCAINYPDILIIQDLYQDKPQRPFIPGSEIAGIVEAIGTQVKTLQIGDHVFAATGNQGGLAEKITLSEKDCYLFPHEQSFEEASSLLLTYATAYYTLKNLADLQAGETLLVLGAAGGVGLAAVELGKVMGAHVIAVASSEEKLSLAYRYGAHAGIIGPEDISTQEASKYFKNQLQATCGQHLPNVIVDPVGGCYCEPALRTIAHRGRYLVIGFTAGIPKIPMNLILLKACQVFGVLWGKFVNDETVSNRKNVQELITLWQAGKIKPFISETFPLAQSGTAMKRLQDRKVMGKVVVTMESID